MVSPNAVTSLLALSQGANPAPTNALQMPAGMQPETLASVLAARGAGV